MKPIRVLQVIDEISVNSGVNSVVMNYYNYIDKSKVIFDFLVHKTVSHKNLQQFQEEGSKVFEMPTLKSQNLIRYIRMLKEFYKKHQEYKIVHGHLPNAAFFYLGFAKISNVPVRIIHSHNNRSGDSFFKKLRNDLLNRLIPTVANNYAACSENAAAFLFGKHAKDAFLLYNAVDIDKYAYSLETRNKIRDELGLSDNQFLVGHVGRFCNQKNHMFLIDVFSEICSSFPDYRNSKLLLIGNGELYYDVQKKVELLKMTDNIIFLGISDRVHEYLQAMDAFVLPSLFEGFPVSAVEAQISGLPCFLADTITAQASFSKSIQFLSLQESPSVWANKVCASNRSEKRKTVYDPRFDIRVQSKVLERYYLSLYQQVDIIG